MSAPELAGGQDFILGSSTSALVAGVLGLTSAGTYVAFHVVLALTAVILPFIMPRVRRDRALARLLYVILAGSAVVAVLFDWVAGYDAVTVIGCSLAVLARHGMTRAFGWFLMSFNHTSLTVLALGAWLAVTWVSQEHVSWRSRLQSLVPAAAGVIVGAATIWLLVRHWGGVTSRTEVYLQYGLDFYLNALIAGLPLVAFTALGIGWVVLLDSSVRAARATVALLVWGLGCSLALPLLALDHTRTISLTLLPALLAWSVVAAEYLPRACEQIWRRYAIAATIVPVPVLVDGVARNLGWQNILFWQSNFPA
jgi:hypothetical protein